MRLHFILEPRRQFLYAYVRNIALVAVVGLLASCSGNSKSQDNPDAGGHSGYGGMTSISTCDPGCDYLCDATSGCACVCRTPTGGSTY